MKLPIKPVLAAVGLALASATAHAQLATPVYGSTAPVTGNNQSLILFVWSPTAGGGSGFGEQVNLNYVYSQLTAASGNLAPNSQSGPWTVAANPTGAAGNVLQLNWNVAPNFSALTAGTGGSGTLEYFVAAGLGNAATGTAGIEITDSTAPTTSTLPPAGVSVVEGALNTMAWNGTGGNTGVDTTGTATYNPGSAGATVNSGTMDHINFAGAINTALDFYNVFDTASGKTTTSHVTQYANTTGAGFWFLSSSGDLSYNVPMSGAPPVPLPAAFWLLASGLAGVGAIGRRRRQGTVAAA